MICGLATDYCVVETVLDARTLGFPVEVVGDAIRAVDLEPGDGDRAHRAHAERRRRGPLSVGRPAAQLWHCGQKYALRSLIFTLWIGVRQRRHGRPARP